MKLCDLHGEKINSVLHKLTIVEKGSSPWVPNNNQFRPQGSSEQSPTSHLVEYTARKNYRDPDTCPIFEDNRHLTKKENITIGRLIARETGKTDQIKRADIHKVY